jgi:hypothetical protein
MICIFVNHRYTVLLGKNELNRSLIDQGLSTLGFVENMRRRLFFCEYNFMTRKCVCNPAVWYCGNLRLTSCVGCDKPFVRQMLHTVLELILSQFHINELYFTFYLYVQMSRLVSYLCLISVTILSLGKMKSRINFEISNQVYLCMT